MDFFIIENGQQVGPLTIAQLAEKHITAETLVWREGMTDWTPAWKVQELRYILEENAQGANGQGNANGNESGTPQGPAVPPIPPTMQTGNSQYGNTQYGNSQYGNSQNGSAQYGNMNSQATTNAQNMNQNPQPKKNYMWLKVLGGFILFILIIMAFTNPSKERHEEAIRTEVSKAIDESTKGGSDIFSQGFRMMARMMAGSFLDSALDQLFEYHNYIFFSKGTVTVDGSDHTVSYGFFGKVITMNADDMVKAIEKDDNLKIEESSSSSSSNDDSNYGDSSDDNSQESATSDDNSSDDDANADIQQKIEDKASKAVDKMVDKASKKMEDKINKKLDEVTDSSTIEKLIDKILELF